MKATHKQVSKLYIFGTVARFGSFSKAADALELRKAAISQHISELERDIGVRLFNRSTRSMALTMEGEELLPHATAMIQAADAGFSAVEHARSALTGPLRITASQDFGGNLLPSVVARFTDRHPGVRVELVFDNAVMDLESDRIDVALQMGVKRRQGLVVRKIGRSEHCVCASPRTAAMLTSMKTPSDLAMCSAAIFTGFKHSDRWVFTRADEEQRVSLSVQAQANSVDAIKQWIAQRPLVAILPYAMVSREMRSGNLVQLLTDWQLPSVNIALAHRKTTDLPARVRAFIDFARTDLARQIERVTETVA